MAETEDVRDAPSPAEALRTHLQRTRIASVIDGDGSRWSFLIRPVSLMTWDPGGQRLAEARKSGGAEAFSKAIAGAVAAPGEAIMRSVLVAGAVSPRLLAEPGDVDGVPIADLMGRFALAFNLYSEIAALSCADILQVAVREAADGKPQT